MLDIQHSMNSSKESPMNEDKMVSDIERMLFLVKTLDTLIRKKNQDNCYSPDIHIWGYLYSYCNRNISSICFQSSTTG